MKKEVKLEDIKKEYPELTFEEIVALKDKFNKEQEKDERK